MICMLLASHLMGCLAVDPPALVVGHGADQPSSTTTLMILTTSDLHGRRLAIMRTGGLWVKQGR